MTSLATGFGGGMKHPMNSIVQDKTVVASSFTMRSKFDDGGFAGVVEPEDYDP